MTASYYLRDPKFQDDKYPESGTVGYDGRGWYYFHGGQLWGPFETKQEAETKENELGMGHA
jgi:hypothetical protein